MEYFTVWMRIGWALWFILCIIALFVNPRGASIVETSRARKRGSLNLVACIIFRLLLTPDIAPYLVTKDTRVVFMIIPWFSIVVQVLRIIGMRMGKNRWTAT